MPTPSTSRARTLQRRLVTAASARFPVKLAALFFSLVLWFMVSAEEPTQEWVDARVVLALDSTVTLQGHVPRVQVLVVGRGRELLKLYASPPLIRRAVGPNTPNDVALDLGSDDVILPSNVDARVRDVRPRTLALRFGVAAARRVPVRVMVSATAAPGIRITGAPRSDPESVLVDGPRERIRALDAVPTERVALVVNTPGFERTVELDTTGLGAFVRPAAVRVHVPAVRDTARVERTDSALGVLSDSTAPDSARRPGARHDTLRSVPPHPPAAP
ncbi:MAG TPA: hypothetical protein VFS44_12830 [Gemmatimonadaceae bacterium]|nr:hypothetical protein [Gemmatimonadaceae bacterium]